MAHPFTASSETKHASTVASDESIQIGSIFAALLLMYDSDFLSNLSVKLPRVSIHWDSKMIGQWIADMFFNSNYRCLICKVHFQNHQKPSALIDMDPFLFNEPKTRSHRGDV
ncbi:hypothetical protein VNO77_23105 [Canavalia gladiata]|uniref:Uncharacterized protein n=1 Tax=Canavalia gladiata TaxID=3824 RepID=A0AAN9L3V6_CANGL